MFFGLLSLAGILLTKQTDAPWPSLYPWLFTHVPGFNAFREASKFYVLIALGYSILIASFVDWLWRNWNSGRQKILGKYMLTILIAFIFLWNLKPIITGEIRSLFIPRQIPQDYITFKDFVSNQPDYFRTLWVPRDSRFGVYSDNHPKVSDVDVLGSSWADIADFNGNELSQPIEDQITDILKQSFSEELLNLSSIKYVVVPIMDIGNDDDFFEFYGEQNNPDIRNWYIDELNALPYLKKIDIGTKDLVVYENTQYKPYIFALNKIYNVRSLDNLNDKYNFVTQKIHGDFNFEVSSDTSQEFAGLYDPFESLTTNEVKNGILTVSSTDSGTLYANTAQKNLYAGIMAGEFQIFSQADSGFWSGNQMISLPPISLPIYTAKLSSGATYYLGIGSRIIPVVASLKPIYLGLASEVTNIDVYSSYGGNAIPNGSFKNGLWSSNVNDCNYFNGDSQIEMRLDNNSSTENEAALELGAKTHIACTGTKSSPIRGGSEYLLSFDYQSLNGTQAGYYLHFNDPSSTVVSQRLPAGIDWQHFGGSIYVPEKATGFSLTVYSYSGNDPNTDIITRYKNFVFGKLNSLAQIPIAYSPSFTAQTTLVGKSSTLNFLDPNYTYQNMIPNPSLESGLWQKQVADCNDYDDNGLLNMMLDTSDKSDGNQSLELDATNHIACTGPNIIDIKEKAKYLLSFDYQSLNGGSAGYNLSFNDLAQTNINGQIPESDSKWHSFTRIIQAPQGATNMILTVYAYSTDGATKMITRYDNFSLIELPDLANRFFAVSNNTLNFRAPSTTFTIVSPTEKVVHVTAATTPFYLSMSESYDPGWELKLGNVLVSPENHFKLDDFLNGWYVDPAALCGLDANGGSNAACTKNSDGSYDMDMVIDFAPQKYFIIGLWISGVTLLGCIAYLIYAHRKRRSHLLHHETN